MAATEDPVVPIEDEAEQPAVVDAAISKEENPPPKSTKARKAAAPKEKKVPAPRKRKSPSHPPYFDVLNESNFSDCFVF